MLLVVFLLFLFNESFTGTFVTQLYMIMYKLSYPGIL